MHYILIFIHFSWPHSDRQVREFFRGIEARTGLLRVQVVVSDNQGAGGSAGATVRATVAWQPSVQRSACRRVDRGCPGRPRSRRLSSGRCGAGSGRRPCIPGVLAQLLRYDGSRSGSRYRTSSGYPGDATYLSVPRNSSGPAAPHCNAQ